MNSRDVQESVWWFVVSRGLSYKTETVDGQRVDSGFRRKDVDTVVDAFLQSAINDVQIHHEWNFSVGEATETITADTAEYELSGNYDDCRDIINIRYGDDDEVLEKLDTLRNDRRKPSRTEEGVYGWTQFGYSDSGFPNIQIHNTPATATTLTYRYWRKLSLADFPDEFMAAIVCGVLFHMGLKTREEFEFEKNHVADNYARGGDEYRPVRLPAEVEEGNLRRNDYQGGM